MAGVDWARVRTQQFALPDGVSRHELATELTHMLGAADPEIRERTAVATLVTWIARGVYDDLLTGLGDGMTTGLRQGISGSGSSGGASRDDSVLRRSASVQVLRACLLRDQVRRLLSARTVLAWGDGLVAWFVREPDNRGVVPGCGAAYALGHGADALAALAGSEHLGRPELTVLLDVIADRVTTGSHQPHPGSGRGDRPEQSGQARPVLGSGDADRLAYAVLTVLRRGEVPIRVVEPWITRVAAAAAPAGGSDRDPAGHGDGAGAQRLLRSLHLQLTLGRPAPPDRGDLVLAVVAALRRTNPVHLGGVDQ